MTPDIPVISVSQLNKHVRLYLENHIGVIHVEGEISNMSKPVSGHCYFTLKDPFAQIRCVFFKSRHQPDSHHILVDGQKILASGHVSLYEARGDYQLIVDRITDAGLGDLYQQFEKLKKLLEKEGLFDANRKKPLPLFPQIIGVITSSTGAAIRDILTTLARRFPLAQVLVFPSEVQGQSAAWQLIKALDRAEKDGRCEILILARGGGSIEDLWAFNTETLARRIAACLIPVITGIGHETDFTIADFVADHRAATPTAAAETITPDYLDLMALFNNLETRLHVCMLKHLDYLAIKLIHLSEKIASPERIIATHIQALDYLAFKLKAALENILVDKQQSFHYLQSQLQRLNPKNRIIQAQSQVKQIPHILSLHMQNLIHSAQSQFTSLLSTLHAVSPLATLDRGYAIATKANKVIYSVQQVQKGDKVDIQLKKGQLHCQVLSKND